MVKEYHVSPSSVLIKNKACKIVWKYETSHFLLIPNQCSGQEKWANNMKLVRGKKGFLYFGGVNLLLIYEIKFIMLINIYPQGSI